MTIGEKVYSLRLLNGLTQEELAIRCELSKGFISQLERDLTSPSIATLMDILECLGTNLQDFFSERVEEKIVFTKKDLFSKDFKEHNSVITWLIPNSQKNDMEPILMTIEPSGFSVKEEPHAGEEFGYILSGTIRLYLGNRSFTVKKGDSFYFRADEAHHLANEGKVPAKVLWISTPPTF